MNFRSLNGRIYCLDVVAVLHLLDMPAISREARGAVFGESQIGGAVNRNTIVIIQINQVAQLQMPRQRGCLRRNALHQVAVRDNGIDIVVEQVFAELGGQMSPRNRRSDPRRKALTERSGGGLDAGCQPEFWVSGRFASPLAKILEFIEG